MFTADSPKSSTNAVINTPTQATFTLTTKGKQFLPPNKLPTSGGKQNLYEKWKNKRNKTEPSPPLSCFGSSGAEMFCLFVDV